MATSSLQFIADNVGPDLTASETQITTAIEGLDGADVTAAQLVSLQAQLALNSTKVAAWSSLAKERADTLKSCCQKFG